jgi:hypothetical protein
MAGFLSDTVGRKLGCCGYCGCWYCGYCGLVRYRRPKVGLLWVLRLLVLRLLWPRPGSQNCSKMQSWCDLVSAEVRICVITPSAKAHLPALRDR